MKDEEYDIFYKRVPNRFADSLIRLFESNIISKHEKRKYLQNLNKSMIRLEQIVD